MTVCHLPEFIRIERSMDDVFPEPLGPQSIRGSSTFSNKPWEAKSQCSCRFSPHDLCPRGIRTSLTHSVIDCAKRSLVKPGISARDLRSVYSHWRSRSSIMNDASVPAGGLTTMRASTTVLSPEESNGFLGLWSFQRRSRATEMI